ncbi:GLE1-domain-containing protein [Meira miltonrushii]|uniref:mRNA export factor GLE1 n=1 Tax=Meira miltonrushii TaxID=1280837 RepID=A0A316V810_9BASI|nr:GLE1-domain-containing protein [Meira miltonrushii]PWN33602.1 GLE1-domain-containing protein [Meira miltonrushii]
MRIALDASSSSASGSDVEPISDGERLDEGEQSLSWSARGLPVSISQQNLQSMPISNLQRLRSRTPSTSSLLLEETTPTRSHNGTFSPGRRRTSNLDKVNAARQLAKNVHGTRSSPSAYRSPKWMRESTPKATIDDDGEEENGTMIRLSESDMESDADSEEEAWPVAPHRFAKVQTSKIGARNRREASVEAQELSQRIRLESEADYSDMPLGKITSQRRRSNSRQVSVPLSPNAIRKTLTIVEDDFDQVQGLLSRMRIEKEREEKQEKQVFDERNKALWDSIETSIRHAEDVQAKALKEEAERQKKIKEQKEADEKRAKEQKEAEEARIKREKEEAEKQKQEDESKRKAAEEEAARKAAEEAKEKSMGGVGNALEANARVEYEAWWQKIQQIKQNVLPAVSQNTEWRKQCFSAKRIITRSVSQLTNSRVEIVRITQAIGEVMTQARGASPGGEIYTWILNHLSKCLIRQAEQEVAAKQDTAFPLARVVQWLLLEGHSELGDVLMARLAKKCCWCIAYCPPKKTDQDDKTYAKILGKAEVDESSLQHTSRMSGIIAMYFAICQTTPSKPPSNQEVDLSRIPAHFRLRALWAWQARMISPRMMEHTITPALFSVMIEIAGPKVLTGYGKQTSKVWKLIRIEGLQNGKAGFTKQQSANSARVRLELLLDEWIKTGRVEGATGGREMAP